MEIDYFIWIFSPIVISVVIAWISLNTYLNKKSRKGFDANY